MNLPDPTPDVNQIDALRELHQHGARLFPVHFAPDSKNIDKKPLAPFAKAWQKRRHDWDDLETYAGIGGDVHFFGLVPDSVGLVALDWDDDGDPDALKRFSTLYPTPILIPSAQAGRYHFYYRADKSRGNGNFFFEGRKRGEVRSAKGYILMYHNGPAQIARYIGGRGFPIQTEFPAELIGPRQKLPPPERDLPTPKPRFNAAQIAATLTDLDFYASDKVNGYRTDTPDMWRGLVKGERNSVCKAFLSAYSKPRSGWKPADFGTFQAFFEHLYITAKLRDDLIKDRRDWNENELRGIVYSVAKYRWTLKNGVDPRTQAHRGRLSGASRRAAVADRDLAIIAARDAGIPVKDVAAQFGVTRQSVSAIIRRGAAPPRYITPPVELTGVNARADGSLSMFVAATLLTHPNVRIVFCGRISHGMRSLHQPVRDL